jgi:hypothetical protein
MPIKSFKGLIAHGNQKTISLHTNDGSTGYRIKKLEVIYQDPGGTNAEGVLKVFSISQSTITDKIDFGDNTLIAAAYIENRNNNDQFGGQTVVFDNVTFNQDIYITFAESNAASVSCNYYIELESMKLDLNENTVVTLKDIRNTNSN